MEETRQLDSDRANNCCGAWRPVPAA